jgi:hypothetical protein
VPAKATRPAPTATAVPGTTAQHPAPFGEKLTGGGVSVELSNGRFANEFGYSEPKGGYKYLIFDTRIEGTDNKEHGYGQMDFSGEDAKSHAGYDSALVFGNGALGSDRLSHGEYVTGSVALEVQETAKSVIIKYDPNQFTSDDLYWLFE